MNYNMEEIARALHDHQNYPFPMPEMVSYERLKKKARKEFEQKARELIEIMDGYRSNGVANNRFDLTK